MLYPQNGSIAIGSRRTTPTAPVAAAVVSDAIVAPRNTPCSQSKDRYTSGTVRARRPPNRMALSGTPCGSSQLGDSAGFWVAGVVKREFGGAAFAPGGGRPGGPCPSEQRPGPGTHIPPPPHPPTSSQAQLVKNRFPPTGTHRK